jgi:lipopolysaccharide biosynthesis regulator YciM
MSFLYLLVRAVPAAFALGWWTSRRAGVRRSGAKVSELSSD